MFVSCKDFMKYYYANMITFRVNCNIFINNGHISCSLNFDIKLHIRSGHTHVHSFMHITHINSH